MRLLSQHKAFEDEVSGRAAHLQQTIKQGEELVADNHFGADKIKERIQDLQVSCSRKENRSNPLLCERLHAEHVSVPQEQWAALERLSAVRKARLQEACNQHQFQVRTSFTRHLVST